MVVVQDEQQVAAAPLGEFVDEQREHGRQGQAARRSQQRTRTASQCGITRLERRQDGSQKAQRVVVLRIQRQPGNRQPASGQKLGQQRGFAEARRGTQQDEGLREARREALDQARARNQARRWARHVELGRQERGERIGQQGRWPLLVPPHDGGRPCRHPVRRGAADSVECGRLVRLALRLEQAGDVLQAGEGQISRPAQVLLAHLLARAEVRIPVALAPLSAFLASAVGACLAAKGKGGELGQPGKPGRTLRDQSEALAARLSRAGIGLGSGRPGEGRGGLRHSVPLVDQREYCDPTRVTQQGETEGMVLALV
jgi:hypothetical protein